MFFLISVFARGLYQNQNFSKFWVSRPGPSARIALAKHAPCLPVRDKPRRCLAETLVRLSGTSSQRTRPKAKNHWRHRSCTATAEKKPSRNAPIRSLPSRNHFRTLLLGPCHTKTTPECSHSAPAVRETPRSAPARPLPSGSLPNYPTRPGVTPPLRPRALQCSGAANTTPADIWRSEVWGTPISRRLKPTAVCLTLP